MADSVQTCAPVTTYKFLKIIEPKLDPWGTPHAVRVGVIKESPASFGEIK